MYSVAFRCKNVRYSHDWASEKHKKGKKVSVLTAPLHALGTLIREYIVRGDILGGAYGYLLAVSSYGYTLDKYLMLWDKNNALTQHKEQ